MNDVHALLSSALPETLHSETAGQVDPSGDLARGRAMARKARARRGVLAGSLLATAGLVVAVPGALHSPAPAPAPAIAAPSGVGSAVRLPTALVAYTGTQPAGYRLARVPEGWVVASSDARHLALAPAGAPVSDTYLDQILIYGDLNPLPAGDVDATVSGRPAKVAYDRDGRVALVLVSTGRSVPTDPGVLAAAAEKGGPAPAATTPLVLAVQLPAGLGWDEPTALSFAAGITLTGQADGARG
ncbi:MAG TPA: hypothetical protein VFS29_02370 [Motilibacteraceae bacterium]|nr:hypothetical protein [Motilibacteraceae bacterium]